MPYISGELLLWQPLLSVIVCITPLSPGRLRDLNNALAVLTMLISGWTQG